MSLYLRYILAEIAFSNCLMLSSSLSAILAEGEENCHCQEKQGNLLSFFIQLNVKNFLMISNQL